MLKLFKFVMKFGSPEKLLMGYSLKENLLDKYKREHNKYYQRILKITEYSSILCNKIY